jgi:heme exporter protein A
MEAGLTANAIMLQRGHRLLLKEFDLVLSPSDGVSLRGANGSGKTTLLRALAGLHAPRAGSISGQNQHEDAPPQISFLGHVDPIKAGQKLGDQLAFWAEVAGKSGADIQAIAGKLSLSRQLDLQGGVLSAGQRRRASLARLLLEDRPIWLLDEPAAPLDTDGRALLGQVLDAHRAKGGMFVAAVHDELPGQATRTIWLDAS